RHLAAGGIVLAATHQPLGLESPLKLDMTTRKAGNPA
ncbi:MAG TPA: cytochrome C biogenesis protein, partial [Rhizobiaceae bacterium]|nr:cytochrome C biogenesis protein [Rhizobiaceae bacterium]